MFHAFKSSSTLLCALALGSIASLATAGCSTQVESEADIRAAAQAETQSLSNCMPPAPAALSVPAGNRLAFQVRGVGAQIYVCTANALTGSYSWVFKAPDADLFWRNGRLAGSHYIGPTWEALDGSTIGGAKVTGVTVDPTAVPWLLLKAVSNTGAGAMSNVTFVQRLNTTRGLAPAAASCDVNSVGQVANVDYTADYYFYKASSSTEPTTICK